VRPARRAAVLGEHLDAAIGGESTSSLGVEPRIAATLAYAGAWISGLIFLLVERDSAFVKYHAAQSAIGLGGLTALALASWVFGLLMAFVSPMMFRTFTVLAGILWIGLVVAWVTGMVQAWRGKWFRMPWVSGRVERWLANSGVRSVVRNAAAVSPKRGAPRSGER
jgi:uncharacterized membrane protein